MTRPLLAIAVAACAVALAAGQAPDRTRQPRPGPPPSLNLPATWKRQLTNGLQVWLVELHEVPVVQVNLVVPGGASDDPPGKFGAASLAVAMLTEGAGSRSSLEIADAIDFLGADLEATAGVDASAVRLHVPVARLAEALPVMADVALRPSFPRDELERLRRQRLTAILQARDNPAAINATAFPRVLYGAAHRYGLPIGGTADTIQALTVDDLRTFYAASFRPGNAALLIVGDVTMDKALPLVESSFGGWRAPGPPEAPRTLPAAREPAAREIYLVDKPGAPQSQVRIGGIGVPRSTPDYFPIQVMNTMLGGSFSSRLNLNLREKHGYTYGAASAFDMRASAGPFVATAAVQTDKTAESIREFFGELDDIRKPVPADEPMRAKNYIALRYPGGFETTGDMSRRLEDAFAYRLPDDYFAAYVGNLNAVTAADVQRVALGYIQPTRFVVVVTGDAKTIEPPIRALNLGPVTTLTIDDVFGPPPRVPQ